MSEQGTIAVIGAGVIGAAVLCAGMGSQPLLAPFGLHAPLQAVRGYHIEMPGHAPLLDAPVVYTREHVVVTPMAGRLRASSYMEFAAPDAPAAELVADMVAERSPRLPIAAFDLRRFS
jgi:glycine/D-amino acid oxidase-like deaminating enzyme